MEKIAKEVFTPYLYEAGSIRPMLEKPFPCGDYIAATDTRVLLIIKKDLLQDTFEEVRNAPDVMKVIPEINCELLLTHEQISLSLGSLPHEKELQEVEPEIECPECDGDGQVEWEYQDRNFNHYTDWADCPCCKGSGIFRKAVMEPTGRMRVDLGAFIIINGVAVWAYLLELLLDTMDILGIKEVRILSLNNKNACMIRIADGIDFIFMPTFDLSSATAIFHLNINKRPQ